ncbi:MAG: hypothetical protein QG635_2166 [Bacteroidota bacterium]|nr:hypothetical protein [Bacteroidota bacterium]
MNITEIRHTPAQTADFKIFSKLDSLQKAVEKQAAPAASSQPSVAWQKDILLQALDMLENSMHLDNSHPLDRVENTPIETFDEAVIELSFLKQPVFLQQASGAQANLKPEDVLPIFSMEDITA